MTKSIAADSDHLDVDADGATLRFPALWLRDNCPCVECRDPRTGQKFLGITDLAEDTAVTAVEQTDTEVTVVLGPDGHRSTFSRSWLAGNALDDGDPGDGRTERGKRLWLADDLRGRLPEGSWADYLADPAERVRCLDAVLRQGFVLLRDVPCEDGAVRDVAESFGYVRETNYGSLFDVRVEATPNNLAFTGLAISPHTDNPYRDPVPTLQLLHCLRNAVDGGETGLVDGFRAAALLRAEDPEVFAVLAGTPVPFAFADADTALRADRPLIGVDPAGRIREVRFNNRSIQPLRLPYQRIVEFYAAYRRFAELLVRPDLLLTFRLAPGDCLIFDNTRVLHARTAFADTGDRHLQGCYADLDSLISSLAVLRRKVDA
ncbi:2-trimethylaminoethylphosphonate dioxygenase [Solihabitans fulvus]|nr:TauD/TfdA family dioxygenase [Solihabitans fulvus]